METKTMLNVEELKDELNTGDYGYNMSDYSTSYICVCDAISEIADSNTSIYWSDISTFISENVSAVEDAIDEFGWDGCGGKLMMAGQMGEYLLIQRDIYENLADCLKLAAYEYLMHELKYSAIPEELNELIVDMADEEDNNAQMDAIPNAIDKWLEENQ